MWKSKVNITRSKYFIHVKIGIQILSLPRVLPTTWVQPMGSGSEGRSVAPQDDLRAWWRQVAWVTDVADYKCISMFFCCLGDCCFAGRFKGCLGNGCGDYKHVVMLPWLWDISGRYHIILKSDLLSDEAQLLTSWNYQQSQLEWG